MCTHYTPPKQTPKLGYHLGPSFPEVLCLSVSFSLCRCLFHSLFLCLPLSMCLSVCLWAAPRAARCLSKTALHPLLMSAVGSVLPPHPQLWPGLSSPPSASLGPPPHTGTDRVRVRTIQGAWPSEGTASSIRGWVLTKLRISSGKALEALYCMPGAAQHPGLDGDGGWSGQMWGSPYRGSDSPGDALPYPKGLSVPHLCNGYS